MSDEAAEIVSTATPERQAEAEKIGWIPPSRFKGDAENFLDAEDYIKRGETVLPFVKQQLASTRSQLATQNVLNAEQARLIANLNTKVEDIEMRFSAEKAAAVERARAEVKAALAVASENNDHAAVAELTDQLTRTAAAAEAPKKEEKKVEQPAPVKLDPEYVQWREENPWFSTDRRKTALALGIAEDLRAKGEQAMGRAFYDKVKEEMDKELGVKASEGSKVEGGRNGGNEPPAGRKAGYSSLPADAKAACDADAKRFVGKGKRFETEAEWRNNFVEIYNRS